MLRAWRTLSDAGALWRQSEEARVDGNGLIGRSTSRIWALNSLHATRGIFPASLHDRRGPAQYDRFDGTLLAWRGGGRLSRRRTVRRLLSQRGGNRTIAPAAGSVSQRLLSGP